MKRILLIFLNLYLCFFAVSDILQIKNKIAKVGDEIILAYDVKKYAKFNNITFEQAKDKLIEKALLYIISKKEIDEPDEDELKKAMQLDKLEYASLIGKNANEVSDEEFIQNLHYNNLSLKTYKEKLKKDVWIQKYLIKLYVDNNIKSYVPSDEEINEFIKKNQDIFLEGAGVYLSMIYMSFFDTDGNSKDDNEIKELYKDSNRCLDRLINNESFEEMVILYSEDLISKNQTPKGRAGKVLFDDPRVERNLSKEILSGLKSARIGIIKKVFETNNGLYIFKIDDIIKPKLIDNNSCKIKAKSILKKRYKEEEQNKLKKKVLEELKKNIMIEIY